MEASMPRESATRKSASKSVAVREDRAAAVLQGVLWRLDRLERQVRTLSELVRDHAEDADRVVRIVGEDHEVLRRELLQEHRERLRARKRTRSGHARADLTR
jgi:hypothetical protein